MTFKDLCGYVENCDITSGHGSSNSHTLYQQYDLKPLINYNNRDYIEMDTYLNNVDVSHVIGFINSHTLFQLN